MTTPGKLLLFLAAAAGLFILPDAYCSDRRPARKIHFSGSRSIRPGELEVVVVPGSSKVVRFAGRELSAFLSKRLGFPVPVRNKPAEKGRSIILGFNALSRKAGIVPQAFCRDSFAIRTSGNRIFIAGPDDPDADPAKTIRGSKTAQYFERATLFGVYDFLERFAGIRFYFAGRYGTVIPKTPMTLPEKIDIFDRPDFEIRKLNMETGYFSEKPGHTVRPRNRYSFGGQKHPEKNLSGYRLRLQTLLQPNSHGLAHLQLDKRFAKTHPEYFALCENGKRDIDPKANKHPFHLCFSSDVKQEILRDARAYLSGRPAAERNISRWNPHGQCSGIFDIQPQDGFVFCRCGKCRNNMSSPQNASRYVWDFILDIAEQLQKEKVPGTLQMMAYYPYTMPPQRKLPENVLVQVAVNGPWMHRLNPSQERLVRAWKEKNNGKVMLWNYCGKWNLGQRPGIPHWTPRRIGDYYRDTAPFITGAYMLCDGDYYLFSALNMYVFAKTAWDNRCDTAALMDEFYRLMFGPAEKEMKRFFDRLEELWLKTNSNLVETVTGPLIAPPSEYELFELCYSPAELQRMTRLFDTAEKKAAADREALTRIRFMRWNFLDRIGKAAQKYHSLSDSISSFRVAGSVQNGAPEWDRVTPLYLQRSDQKSVSDPTSVKAVLAGNDLALQISCTEPEMKLIDSSASAKPSGIWKQDNIEIFLNPGGDRKNYFQIIINSSGVIFTQQGVLTGQAKSLRPVTIPGLKHKVEDRKNGRCYTVIIPTASLPGFRKQLVCNFNRNQSKKGKQIHYTWSPFTGRNNHDLQRFGVIDFAASPIENRIPDGDFTAAGRKYGKFGMWNAGKSRNGVIVQYDNGSFISGNRSLKITREPSAERAYSSVSIPLKLRRNQRYRLRYYIKLDRIKITGRGGGVNVGLWSGRNRWIPRTRLSGTTPWILQSAEFVTDEKDNENGNLNLFMYRCTGTVNFDHLILEEIK